MACLHAALLGDLALTGSVAPVLQIYVQPSMLKSLCRNMSLVSWHAGSAPWTLTCNA